MSTTYVYAAVAADGPVELDLIQLGPDRIGASLLRRQLPPRQPQTLRVAEIPRVVSLNVATLTLPFAVVTGSGPRYVASLNVLIRGRGFDSMIWWRWRRAAADTGLWVTDHAPHSDEWVEGGRRHRFTVQGIRTWGYDDIRVELVQS